MQSRSGRPRTRAGSTSAAKARSIQPGIAEQDALGNAAIQDAIAKMRITEERGSLGGGPERAGPTSAATAGSKGAAGVEDAASAAQHMDAQVVSGQKWGDTFGGARVNARGGAGDMGLGRFARDGYTGGGAGHTSSGPIESDEERAAQQDKTAQEWGAASDMSDADKEAYLADQFYGGFDSMEEFQAYADQMKAEAETARPREDDAGGGTQTGPNPLDKSRDPGKKAGTPLGIVGGAGDGRGVQEAAGGRSVMDGKSIGVKAGGSVGKERKEPEAADISMEQALKANFHTDPTRGRGT